MCNCGDGKTPSDNVPPPAPTLGEAELVLIEKHAGEDEAVYGKITGARYPFDDYDTVWVDVRDWEAWEKEFFREKSHDAVALPIA